MVLPWEVTTFLRNNISAETGITDGLVEVCNVSSHPSLTPIPPKSQFSCIVRDAKLLHIMNMSIADSWVDLGRSLQRHTSIEPEHFWLGHLRCNLPVTNFPESRVKESVGVCVGVEGRRLLSWSTPRLLSPPGHVTTSPTPAPPLPHSMQPTLQDKTTEIHRQTTVRPEADTEVWKVWSKDCLW